MGWHGGKFRGSTVSAKSLHTPNARIWDIVGPVLHIYMIFNTLDAFYGFTIGFLLRGSDFEGIMYWRDYCLLTIL